jgi:hypothetical protein
MNTASTTSSTVFDQFAQRLPSNQHTNVGHYERIGSLIVGGALAAYGLSRLSPGFAAVLVGGALVYRGLSGYCNVYQALGLNTATTEQGVGAARPSNLPQDKVLGPLDNPVDLASDDSFPASDPPAFNSFT